MGKKKKSAKTAIKKNEFNCDPFKNLKGFAVSAPGVDKEPVPQAEPDLEVPKSFSAEMEKLGVRKLELDEGHEESFGDSPSSDTDPALLAETEDLSDADLFLSALGELTVNFSESFSEDSIPSQAEPRRMKQLKQGKITPDASLDLHGCKRLDVAAKISYFLQNSQHHGYRTVIVITGKGLHSESGEAVLREEAERFLTSQSCDVVVEWGRAPKQYGGSGALVVFLRHQ